ncbi:MAG: leucine-rich repeat domain-containing protein [Oscillospiraceae bacterium]|jgi:hypothetical protein|nr:leucine-rich repeat domain-containing protein [Oscillospiraceae bacterium]
MKRIPRSLLSLLLAALLLLSVAPITAIPAFAAGEDISVTFTDPNFLAAVRTALGKQPTDPITAEECAAVKTLNVSNKAISNLSGIEYFTELTTLDCGMNNLTALELSENAALQVLYCYGNPNLASLDLSNNPALTTLNCSQVPLVTLDLSGNPALTMLTCRGSQLTNLNLSGNPELQVLDCTQNQLASLNISANTKLFVLSCDDNQLTALDTSKNSVLEGLTCTNNAIFALDLSKNLQLNDLRCGNNALQSLDLTKNTKLSRLDCDENQLAALDLTKNVQLSNLNCAGNQIGVFDITKNTQMRYLDCSNNQLLALDISKNTQLRSIFCAGNQLKTLDISNLSWLDDLDVSNNYFPAQAAIVGLDSVQVTRFTYEPQNLDETDILPDSAIPDAKFRAAIRNALGLLSEQPILRSVCAFWEDLDVSAQGIADLTGIEYFTGLKYLFCNENSLTDVDFSKLTALEHLNCSGNELAKLDLSQNTKLNYLDCSNNQIFTLDLSRNMALESLHISNNSLRKIDLFNNTAKLESLDARLNYFQDEYADLILDDANFGISDYQYEPQKTMGVNITNAFTDPNFLAAVYIALNKTPGAPIYAPECLAVAALNLTEKDIKTLAGLEYFPNIALLVCANNKLTEIDISNNKALQYLVISENKLTTLDVTNNPKLMFLDIRKNLLPSESAVIGLNRELTTTFLYDPQRFTGNEVTAAFTDSAFLAAVRTALGKEPDDPIGDQDCARLEQLDVRNLGITSLDGIEYFTGLKALICSGNQLSALDLSNSPALLALDCSNNHLTGLDFTQNPDLIYLLATKNFIASETDIIAFDSTTAEIYEFLPQNGFVITAPTCTEQGYTTWTCDHEPTHTFANQEIAANGHAFGDWQIRTPATCTAEGVKFRVCSVCGVEETDILPAIGHDYVSTVTAPTCTEKGYTTWTCSHDATHKYVDNEVAALGHNYFAVVTEPTYTTDGFTTHTCSRCGDSYVDSVVKKLTIPLSDTLKLEYKQSTDAFTKNDTPEIKWHSSNTKVLTIDETTGEITYHGRGSTTIKAKLDGVTVAQTRVTVEYNWWQWILAIFLFGWAWL